MPIDTLPTTEQPREKLLANGEKILSDAELLAILLRTGNRQKNAIALSRQLLTEFGSLENLFRTDYEVLSKTPGIGLAKFTQLRAARELSRRLLLEPLFHKRVPQDSEGVRQYLIAELRYLEAEVFACLFLDLQFRLIRFETLFTGTFNQAAVYPREVAKRALALNAAALIIAHNHPHGTPYPSEADQQLTEKIVQILSGLDVELIDHILVAGNTSFSFKENGLL